MDKTDFTEGKIVGPLLRFVFPIMFAIFLQILYGAVDLLIVGKFSDATNVSAVSTDYPVQLMNIVSAENDGIVLSETGTADSSPLAAAELGGSLACSWRFDYVGTDQNGAFFKI